jgi:hypothetical protein
MKKGLKIFFIVFGILIISVLVWMYTNIRDRHPGYEVSISVTNNTSAPLRAGFAALPITPEVPDRWTDVNGDSKYIPEDGDTYEDLNGNGRFDAVWIAGFGKKRAANGIHDDLWARTMVIDDGTTRMAFVALDAIGFMHDDIVDVRNLIEEEAGITYAIVHSTHTHEAPDLLGLWGPTVLKSGIDPEYMRYVKTQAAASVRHAVDAMRPAKLKFVQNLEDGGATVIDTRKPIVFDSGLRLIHATDRESGATLGTLVSWANHPETLWSGNLEITSDFPHYIRHYIENGIYNGDSLLYEGVGGTAVYINGAIGGLMTTRPNVDITDPVTGAVQQGATFAKADAQGKELAILGLKALRGEGTTIDEGGISLYAKTLQLPLDNPLFRLGAFLGVLDRGMHGWMHTRSEVSFFTLGPASFITVPGELYPEIANGGIEAPEGQDYPTGPVEVPPLRELMQGRYQFLFGVSNDMIGYIIPKSEWDEEPPFLYGAGGSPYGEVNSMGPETATIVHAALVELLTSYYD